MENKPIPRREPPLILLIFWFIIWGLMGAVMFLSAILGLICVVVGILSFFVDRWPLELYVGGALVRTGTEKALFILASAALALIGIGFWWLRRRGYVAAAVVLYVGVFVLVLVLGWLTGKSDLISIGFASD